MIRGYVSSDEDDYEDYDFGYSEPLVIKKNESFSYPPIQTQEIKEKLHSALEETKKIELFLRAVDLGDITVLAEFIALGVSANSTDSQDWTPLMKACGAGKVEVVQFLLENGADPNKHRELFTPLMTCCTHTLVTEDLKLTSVRLLLQHGADINAKDKYRTTALMYAVGSGYTNIVCELLEAPGINVNMQDKEGWTALFFAVNSNDINLVKKLVSAGTDLKLKDKYSRSVINLALDKDLKEIAKVLGYIEESPKLKQKLTLSDRFLKELPNSEGQGGFTTDAQDILFAFKQFKVKSISLPDLLNATEKDLYEIGVKLQPDIKNILIKGIHQYHLHPWRKSSMHQITQGVPLSLQDAIAITGDLAKHLTLANASLKYVNTRIFLRQNKEPLDIAVEKETIMCLINTYQSGKKLNMLLPKILELSKQIKREIPGDYIHPCEKKKYGKKFITFFWWTAGAATIGLLISYYKSNPPFRTFI